MRLSSLRLPVRLALAVSVAGVTAFTAAAPAYADPEPESDAVELYVPDRVVTTDGRAKTVSFEVTSSSDETVSDLVLVYGTGTGEVDPRIGFKPPAGCTTTVCGVGDLAPRTRRTLTFTVQPTADLPAAGASFGVTLHDGSGKWKETTTVTVVRTAQGVDLEAGAIADIKLDPGKSAVVPIAVRNNGNAPATGLAVVLAGTKYTTFPSTYRNCTDVADLPGIVCVFDTVVRPGVVFGLDASTPLTVQAAPATPGPADYASAMYTFAVGDEAPDADVAAAVKKLAAAQTARRSGALAQLVPARSGLAAEPDPDELNEWDNTAAFDVKVGLNPADVAAIGDDFEGAVGDTKTIKVGFRNNGPAVVLGPAKAFTLSAKVRIPSGLKLTKVDQGCVPNGDGEPSPDQPGQVSGHDYLCVADTALAPGKEKLFSFTAKIQDGRNEDAGSITVKAGVQDKTAANDTAAIKVKLTGGSGGGSGDGSDGGGLPVTGAPAGLTAASGLLLMLAGGLLLVVTRRRRATV